MHVFIIASSVVSDCWQLIHNHEKFSQKLLQQNALKFNETDTHIAFSEFRACNRQNSTLNITNKQSMDCNAQLGSGANAWDFLEMFTWISGGSSGKYAVGICIPEMSRCKCPGEHLGNNVHIPMHDYKCPRIVVITSVILVNTNTHTCTYTKKERDRERETNPYDRLATDCLDQLLIAIRSLTDTHSRSKTRLIVIMNLILIDWVRFNVPPNTL